MAVTGRARGRTIRQKLPTAPPTYDQTYIAKLAEAVNDYMIQATAPAEVVAARFICVDPIVVGTVPPADVPDTTTLPTGMFYLKQLPGAAAGTYYLTLVLTTDLAPPP